MESYFSLLSFIWWLQQLFYHLKDNRELPCAKSTGSSWLFLKRSASTFRFFGMFFLRVIIFSEIQQSNTINRVITHKTFLLPKNTS